MNTMRYGNTYEEQQPTTSENHRRITDRRWVVLESLLESALQEVGPALLKLISGIGFTATLMALATDPVPVLSASAAAAAMFYLGSISGAQSAKDGIFMLVSGVAIPVILLSDINGVAALGFALLIHTMTSFYGMLNKPSGALSEMQFWPFLMGFHGTAMLSWIILAPQV